jgi:pre-mRNA-processing factor 40
MSSSTGLTYENHSGVPGMLPAPSGFTPISQNNALILGSTPSFDANATTASQNGLPMSTATSGALPLRPNLPEDPIIPHNGFATIEEGEKAFTHLLRKAGVNADWTWDMTMRTIITDPLYKALNTLAQKKNCWQKVRSHCDYA